MKKKSLLLFLFFITLQSHAQDLDSLTLSELKINFAVPDLPAFKTLGSEPSNLLRPSTAKALATSFSPFYDHQKIVVPKAFAMEISPALLINANKGPVQLITYAKNAWINSFRISLGTATVGDTGRNLSLGVRITPIDKSDPLADVDFIKNISEHLKLYRLSENVYKRKFAESIIDSVKQWANQNQQPDNLDSIVDWDYFLDQKISHGADADTIWKYRYEAYKETHFSDSYKDFDLWIVKEKEDRKKYNWNATKLDFAAAILSSSPDSLVKNVEFSKAQLWVTYAHKAGKSGEFLMGVTATVFKNSIDTIESQRNKTYSSVSVPMRYLIGTNRVKGFVEFQYSYETKAKISNTLIDLGAELNLIDGLWVNLTGGLTNFSHGGKTALTGNMNVKLTLPEKFKLF